LLKRTGWIICFLLVVIAAGPHIATASDPSAGVAQPLQRPAPRSGQGESAPQPERKDRQQMTDREQHRPQLSSAVIKGAPAFIHNIKSSEQTKQPNTEPASIWGRSTDVWLAVFTGLLVFVGTLQFVVFGLQARRLRQTIETMRATERRQLRAYVGIDMIALASTANLTAITYAPYTPSVGTACPDFMIVNLMNFGQTPANHVHIWVNWMDGPVGLRLPDDFNWPRYDGNTPALIRPIWTKPALFPGKVFQQRIPIPNLEGFRQAAAGRLWMYAYGDITYVDIYGRECTTTFCFHYNYDPQRAPEEHFVPYEAHNEAK
jgi:hypothetical protein